MKEIEQIKLTSQNAQNKQKSTVLHNMGLMCSKQDTFKFAKIIL